MKVFHVKHFDVVVVGGGHAGCEAALSAARMGVETLLVSMDSTKGAEMSCNPSIGGVGKGQLVKEIDALGGEMGRNADYTGIMFKRLNTRKGSAVQSSRCQSDKKLYAQRMQGILSGQPKLTLLEGEVKALLSDGQEIQGLSIQTKNGEKVEIVSKNVVITAGTFMRGLMHVGFSTCGGGRFGEKPSEGLSDSLRELGLTINRLKTGTPARLLRESIDFSQMELQLGDVPPQKFSFWESEIPLNQVPCYLVHTNKETHRVIRENLHRSPLYSGKIQGVGPRYCPSIEDKVVKFPDKERHQLFFEPESLTSKWIYPNGISTSLPSDVQEAFLRTIPGCQDVQVARHGYAVEYDCIDPTQLKPSLETKHLAGLFLGGQVNGTSGYEEAAAQGLMAGMNAALRSQGRSPLLLSRTESYIGVMIDDLTQKGVVEPYRMFTSRAEFRLSLREDNADIRLSRYGYEAGLLPEEKYRAMEKRKAQIAETKVFLSKTFVKPTEEVQKKLEEFQAGGISGGLSLLSLLKRPELSYSQVLSLLPDVPRGTLDSRTEELLEVEVKYEGYIRMQQEEIERLGRLQETRIPEDLDYKEVIGLSIETREKLGRHRPATLAAASQVSGVTPAALTSLLFHIRQKGRSSAHP